MGALAGHDPSGLAARGASAPTGLSLREAGVWGDPPPGTGPTYFAYAYIQSVAISCCACAKESWLVQTSRWRVFSSVSLTWALRGIVSYDCGQRLRMEFEPPSSMLISWSISYSPR